MALIDEHLDTLRDGTERLRALEDEERLRRAHEQARAGDYGPATATLGDDWASARADLRIGALLLQARMAAQQAEIDAAGKQFREILELDPGNGDASAGVAALARGRRLPPGLHLASRVIIVAVVAGVAWAGLHLASTAPAPLDRAGAVSPPGTTARASGLGPGGAPAQPAGAPGEPRPVSERLAAVRADLTTATRAFVDAGPRLSTRPAE